MFSRRTVLVGSAAAGASALGSRWMPSAMGAPAKLQNCIDAHCHIFNAADLPIREFVRKVYFNVYDPQVPSPSGVCITEQAPPGSWGRKKAAALAWTCEKIGSAAPTAKAELDWLTQGGVVSGGPTTSPAVDIGSILHGVFSQNDGGVVSSANETEEDRFAREGLKELEEELILQARKSGYILPARFREAGGVVSAAGGAESPFSDEQESRTIWSFLKDGADIASSTIAWVTLLTKYRFQLADQIVKDYVSDEAEFRLYTPALIDYSHWLQNEPRSSLAEQVEVMDQISRRAGKVKFHGFVGYDPLRDVHENGAALLLAQKAVREKGFLGVKLYPPMGFKPWKNAEDDGIYFSSHTLHDHAGQRVTTKQLAGLLDGRLENLYKWCAAEHVPILAHATRSYGSGPGYSCRANPANWDPVIKRFPDLRLCLAHFGDFGEAIDEDRRWIGQFPSRIEQTWEWHFATLVKNNPSAKNVYADVSYYAEVMRASRRQHKENLANALIKTIGESKEVADRLVYGTDWLLLAREKPYKQHLNAVRTFMKKVFEKVDPLAAPRRLDALFRDSAVACLGLKDELGTRKRLKEYYEKNGLDSNDFLGSF